MKRCISTFSSRRPISRPWFEYGGYLCFRLVADLAVKGA